jgi:hypothetical protein
MRQRWLNGQVVPEYKVIMVRAYLLSKLLLEVCGASVIVAQGRVT